MVRLGERARPISLATEPVPGSEATGRFVTLKVVSPAQCSFTLKHMWVGSDVGLVPGMPIHGQLRLAASEAIVTVLVPDSWVLFPAAIWLGLGVLAVRGLIADVDTESVLFALMWIWFAVYAFTRSRKAAEAVAEDAVVTLESVTRC